MSDYYFPRYEFFIVENFQKNFGPGDKNSKITKTFDISEIIFHMKYHDLVRLIIQLREMSGYYFPTYEFFKVENFQKNFDPGDKNSKIKKTFEISEIIFHMKYHDLVRLMVRLREMSDYYFPTYQLFKVGNFDINSGP